MPACCSTTCSKNASAPKPTSPCSSACSTISWDTGWLFQNLHKLNDRPRELREALFDTLFTMAEIAKFKGEELEQYRLSMEFYDDTEARIEYAKDRAAKVGMQQGIQLGMQKGEQRGQESAREEIARNLKTLGLPAATIAQSTGLSSDRIAEL